LTPAEVPEESENVNQTIINTALWQNKVSQVT